MDKLHLVLVLGVLIVTSGCMASQDQQPDEADDTPDSEVDRTIEISGGSYYFEPDNINIEREQTVKFVLSNDGGQHDLRIPELGVGTSVISGGETESFTVTFEDAGEYRFICSVGNHAELGMNGTITVN